MIRKTIFAQMLLIVLIISDLSGQDSQVLHYMNLPQSHLINPALKPSNSFFVGLPVLSGISLNVNSNFVNLSDILMKSLKGDSVISIFNRNYNIDKFLLKIKDKILIEPHFTTQLFSLGFGVGNDGYVFFDITERLDGNIVLPSELFELVLKGNKQFLGSKIDLSSLKGDFKYYREAGLGFSKNLTRKLRIGVRGKLLFGIAGLAIDNRSLGISVDNNYLAKFNADLTVNMSAPVNISLYPDHTIRNVVFDKTRFKTPGRTYDFLSGKDNLGLGLDVGATYNITDKLMVSASITDIGFINWKKDVTNLLVKSKFEFGGLDVAGVIDGAETFEDLGDEMVDSLKRAFNFTRSSNHYTENLQYSLRAGACFNITKSISSGVLLYRKILDNQVNESLTFSANVNLTNRFSSSLSYTLANYQHDGLGIGMAFRAGIFQLYLLGDRIPVTWNRIRIDKTTTIWLPSNWNIVNIRLGLNLVFGDQKQKADRPMLIVE
jgi:hypothetical protein